MTTADLLDAWRDATLAAELAERLAKVAEVLSKDADDDAAAAEEVAYLAEQAAQASNKAAQVARAVADRAATLALSHQGDSSDAGQIQANARELETRAKSDFNDAERAAGTG